ncbi:MAG: hypothetical protein DDT32_01494 [Syntrophomonadaceae bacterium]|nr:hypothetical protein [Bacillota bacterium]
MVGNILVTETRANEFGVGYILLLTICIFAGVLLIVVVPDSVRSANLFSAERSTLLVSEFYVHGNRERSLHRSLRGSALNTFLTMGDAFRHATNELRMAARPPSDKSGSRTVLRRR